MLALLMNDHRNIKRVMTLLHHKITAIRDGKAISYDVLHDIISYLQDDVSRFHHFKEEHIYDYCLAKELGSSEVFTKLKAEHLLLAEKGQQVAAMIDRILRDTIVPFDQLSTALEDFTVLQRQHMSFEDTEAHPLIDELLQPSDWAQIQTQLLSDTEEDRLFGEKVAQNYAQLAQRISQIEAETAQTSS